MVIKTTNGWLVAGDSKAIYATRDPIRGAYVIESTQEHCKIRTKRNLALIVWGPEWSDLKGQNPDLRHLSQQVLDSSNGSAVDANKRLADIVNQDQQLFTAILSQSGGGVMAGFGWAFVDFRGFHGVEYEISKNGNTRHRLMDSSPTINYYAFAAASEKGMPYLKAKIDIGKLPSGKMAAKIGHDALEEVAQQLAQVYGARSSVGPPYSTAEVTPHGMRWIDKGACQGSVVFQK